MWIDKTTRPVRWNTRKETKKKELATICISRIA